MNYPDDMFDEAERRESENKKDFYRFFAVNSFATGEGVSYWLKICTNWESSGDKDYDLDRFKDFIGDSYYYNLIEECEEEEFMKNYSEFIPLHVVKMVKRKDQPSMDWETHFHVNYF